MKDERFAIAGGGLKLMFIGTIVALFSFVPVIGGLAAIVGGIIALVGLVKTMNAAPGYKRAVIMLVLSIVAAVLMAVMAGVAAGGAILGSGGAAAGGLVGTLVLSLAVSVFGFLQVYFVCGATSGLLREIGEDQEASRGDLVWKLNAVCYIIAIVIAIVSVASAGLGGALNVVRTIVSLVANVIYIIFLYKSQQIMLA
ncbi:hypothetical protein CE91St41_12660 [Oscillospiraceae bacterium]|nr:hypothetical protein CE91St40_24880 [Oscillospiraceae bacterium]BDF74377.1 hypothetical protein CE91St41_12660 [Oscillospiraceae bacterium]